MVSHIYPYALVFTLCLLISGCGGGGSCPNYSIGNFSVQTETAQTGTPHPGKGTPTVFSIWPSTKAELTPVALFGSPVRFSLISSAYASSCMIRYNEHITGIEVRSSHDIDEKHRAGTLLNDLLRAHSSINYWTDAIELNEIVFMAPERLEFYFSKPVTGRVEHTLNIKITLDTGASYELTTTPVDLSSFKLSPLQDSKTSL